MAAFDPQKKPDLHIIRGDTVNIQFQVDMDLTGTTVFFTVKPALTDDVGDTTAVISVEVASHDDPANGHTIIPLTADDTNVTPGEYYYDIQIKNGSSIVSIPARKCKIYADVTRRTS
jgi:hypothetical protein